MGDRFEHELDDAWQVELRDAATDSLANLNAHITALNANPAKFDEIFRALYREVQTIKGLAASAQQPVTMMVAQRFDAYLSATKDIQGRTLTDLQFYVDKIQDLIDRRVEPSPEEAANLIHSLPVRYSFEVSDVVVKSVEVMLVTPTRVAGKVVGGELAACGFKPILVHDPLEALAQAVRMPPGMIIASVIMAPISGVELVRALKTFQATKNCPMAVLTSLDGDQNPLNVLPQDVAIVHTGAEFGESFAAAAARFALG